MHSWTERSAQLVGDDFATRGNRVALDVEHLGADPPNGAPPPTAGYATLELRDGEPWLVFDWSAYAVEQIQTRQRLYLSPEYVVERGEIVKLVRVSLVQDPATHNAPRLASNRAQTERTTVVLASRMRAGRNGMDPQTKAKALDALIAKDPEQCMAILKSIVDSAQSTSL